ncbi:copper resistance protein CopC [Phenylobacterium sp.]|uniref:copper resistance protein CopC n=1 Tax=Phenylobacterium sp. TaxID=1871053 RepID=UPI00374CF16F
MRKIIVATAAIAALAIAGEASAHARLLMGAPKAGSTVAAPKALTLRYSEELVPAASHVTVTGPAGAAIATGPLTVDAKTRRVATVPFVAPPAAGAYKVAWHMKTEDGHETDGTFAFTVK